MRPYQNKLDDTSITIDRFGGINRKKSVGAGEFESAVNLSSDEYPCLMPRKSYDRFLFNKYALQWQNNNKFYALYPAIPYEDVIDPNSYYKHFDNETEYDEWKRTEMSYGYWRVTVGSKAYEVYVDEEIRESEIKSYILTQGLVSVELPDMPYFKNPVCTNISQQTVICDELHGMLVVEYTENKGADGTITPTIEVNKISQSFITKNTTTTSNSVTQISGGDFCHTRILFDNGDRILGCIYAVGSEGLEDICNPNKDMYADYLIAYGDSQSELGSAWFRRTNKRTIERVDHLIYRYWYKGEKSKFNTGDYLHFTNHAPYQVNNNTYGSFSELDGWHEISGVRWYDGGYGYVQFTDFPMSYRLMNMINTFYLLAPSQRIDDDYGKGGSSKNLGLYWADGFTISRDAPENVGFMCTSNNRVWCNNGQNEIMCCSQGNPYSWYKYEGTVLDSYAVTVGGDGSFTGCIEYGYPMFFKNDEVFRVSGTRPSNYQVDKYSMRGVKNGCHNSLAIVNDALYYQSKDGIYKYAGTTPVCISDRVYQGAWEKGYACKYRDKYYICVYERISSNKASQKLYSYDTQTGIWHEESFASGNVIAIMPGNFRNREEEAITIVTDYTNAEKDISTLLKIEDNSGWIPDTVGEKTAEEKAFRYYGAYTLSTYPEARYSEESTVEWECITGDLLYAYNEHKYLKRLFVTAELDKASSLSVYVEYDRCGRWEKMSTVTAERLNTYRLYVPNLNRCESFKIKLKGRGNAVIHSIDTEFEIGSDYE